MAEQGDQDDKTEEPTQKRLDDARKRGDIVFSTEAAAFVSLLAAAGVLSMGASGIEGLGAPLSQYLAKAHDLPTDGPGLIGLAARSGLLVLGVVALVGGALALAAVTARYVQDKPTFSASKLQPKLETLNPIAGFKRVFGPRAIGAFLKAVAKFAIVGGAAAWVLWPRDATLETMAMLDISAFAPMAKARVLAMLGACLAAFGVVAIVDYIFTRQAYMKRLRMSRQELKDEIKQSEGDPQIKARIRGLRMQRSRKRMLAAVPQATVIITNPTHYAVALRFVQGETPAPVCVAKGVDELALRIREAGEAAGVPRVEDPPLARALFASTEIDEAIPREHYEAVAKVIGFVLRMADRRRGRPAANRS